MTQNIFKLSHNLWSLTHRPRASRHTYDLHTRVRIYYLSSKAQLLTDWPCERSSPFKNGEIVMVRISKLFQDHFFFNKLNAPNFSHSSKKFLWHSEEGPFNISCFVVDLLHFQLLLFFDSSSPLLHYCHPLQFCSLHKQPPARHNVGGQWEWVSLLIVRACHHLHDGDQLDRRFKRVELRQQLGCDVWRSPWSE